jgi:hypothetical protein
MLNVEVPLAAGTRIGKVLLNGWPVDYRLTGSGIAVESAATGSMHLSVSHEGGISVLPLVHHPEPGDSSTGLRIISGKMSGDRYVVTVEGLSGTSGSIRLIRAGAVFEEAVSIPAGVEKYGRQELVFYP